MTIDPLRSASPMIVYIDVKSPYAYIALEPTFALEEELDMRFDWRPLTLDIPSYLGSARKSDSGKVVENNRSPQQWSAVKYAYKDARRYAARQDRLLYGTQKIWDSSIANMSITWVVERKRKALRQHLDNLYTPFWQRDLDIEDVDVVARVLEKSGVSADGFADYVASTGREHHDALQATLHPAGIFGVPTYVVGEEFFFGRENLPYLRWKLSGSKGHAPDIAYEL